MVDPSASSLTVVHLTASPFLGGPERQMLGLAQSLPPEIRTIFWSFAEGGKSRPFLQAAAQNGFEVATLDHNVPEYKGVVRELTERLRDVRPDILFCHGYKADLLGGLAARRVGIPVVAVSRGWTGATWKVRLNELLDRIGLIAMDRVVCVSEGQAEKVRRAGVPSRRVSVIRNAIFASRFDSVSPSDRETLLGLFPRKPRLVVGAAGRLSPEKGFEVLVNAAAKVVARDPSVGFVVFGDGPLCDELKRRIASEQLESNFILVPFRDDLDQLMPHLDLLALPSYTEGLPNVALEASAAAVPIVATDVGGTPEVVENGKTGFLVPSGDPSMLALRINQLVDDPKLRASLGQNGRERIRTLFTFENQARAYLKLCAELAQPRPAPVRELVQTQVG